MSGLFRRPAILSKISKLLLYQQSSVKINRCFLGITSKVRKSELRDDHPLKYSGSQADRDASISFRPPKSNAPSYQPACVALSLAAFLIYFCVLREENDVDEYLSNNVYMYVDPFGESARLKRQLAEEVKAGVDTTQTRVRLDQINKIIMAKDAGSVDSALKRAKLAKQQKKSVIDVEE